MIFAAKNDWIKLYTQNIKNVILLRQKQLKEISIINKNYIYINMPLSRAEYNTRWRNTHREEYNATRRIFYRKNVEKQLLRKHKSYYYKKECIRLRNMLLDL